MKLPAKHAAKISRLVRQWSVAVDMAGQTKPESYRLWTDHADEAILALREYGINLGQTYAEIRAEFLASLSHQEKKIAA